MYTVQSLYDITITPYIIWRYSTGSFSLVKFNHAFDTTYLCKGVYSVGIRYTQWLKYSIQLHTHIIYIPTTPKILKDNILHIIRILNSCDLLNSRDICYFLSFSIARYTSIHKVDSLGKDLSQFNWAKPRTFEDQVCHLTEREKRKTKWNGGNIYNVNFDEKFEKCHISSQIWPLIGPDWQQMGQIWDFYLAQSVH